MKIIVDKLPTKPSECFYAHGCHINNTSGREHGTCWIRGDGDWSTEPCTLGYGEPCPYLAETHIQLTVNATEVKHAHWIYDAESSSAFDSHYTCSSCGGYNYKKSDFCHDCGARMDEDESDG